MSGRMRRRPAVPPARWRSVRLAAALVLCTACESERAMAEREQRPQLSLPAVDTLRIVPGPPVRDTASGVRSIGAHNPYAGNAYAVQDGYRLYRWMNCIGCHGEGGGSIGPTLWDDSWIHGGSPAEIAESIIRGRPNGMPAYGGRLSMDQVWRIVAYVQQLEPGGGIHRAGAK
jgi:cytochrome c oxidase cbb3-type subunit III